MQHDASPVETHGRGAVLLRVRVAGRLGDALALPRLPERVVDVGVVVHERVRVSLGVALALGPLQRGDAGKVRIKAAALKQVCLPSESTFRHLIYKF